VILAGCGGSDPAGGEAAKAAREPFIINSTTPPASLDPAKVNGQLDIGNVRDLYSTLIKVEQKPMDGDVPEGVEVTREDQEHYAPYLAESFEVSDDGLTFTFKLRPEAKFSTGRPVNCEAVKASLERTVKVGASSAYYARAGQPDLDVKFACADPMTFVTTIARRETLMLKMFAQPQLSIVDVEEVKAKGPDGTKDLPANSSPWLATHAAGAGPYILKEYSPGVREVFEANPTFFGERPREQTVIINFVQNEQTLLLQARNGQADVTLGLTKKAIKSLEGSDKANVVKVPTHTTQFIALPNKQAPFDNLKLREALTHAVPYEDILREVAQGYGELYYGPYAPGMVGYDEALSQPRAFDLEKAKALIAESGVKLPVKAELMLMDGILDQAQIAQIVQSTWKQLGVELRIKSVPTTVYNSDEGIFDENKFPLVRWDGAGVVTPLWQLDYDMRCETTKGNTNWTNTADFCSQEAEDLLNAAHRAPEGTDLKAKYWDPIAKIWIAASPRIPVYAETYTAVLDKDVKHWSYNQFGPLNVAAWGR
jgi:peptide/nickel transport system substrate-binding protein